MNVFKKLWINVLFCSMMALSFLVAPLAMAADCSTMTDTNARLKCLLDRAGQSGFSQTSGTVSAGELVGRFVTVFLGLVGTIAFVVFLYGGYLWLTARGSDEQVSQAKKYLMNGTIGIIVIVLAYSLAYFITSQVYKSIS